MSSRVLSVTNQDLQDFRTYVKVWFVCNVSIDHEEFKAHDAFLDSFAKTFEYFEYMNEPFSAAETILDISKATDGSLRVSNEHYQAYMAIHDFSFVDFLPADKVELITSIQKRFKKVLDTATLKEEDTSIEEYPEPQGKQFLN